MTISVDEEYQKILDRCNLDYDESVEHGKTLELDLDHIEKLAARFLGRNPNDKITAREAYVLSLYVKQAIQAAKIEHHMNNVQLMLIAKLALLSQVKTDMELKVPENIQKQLQEWSEWQEQAKKAASAYQQ
jgi:hypothetical protein